jgi:O-methyltransferase
MILLESLKSRFADSLIRRDTMVGPERIANLARLAQRVEDEEIPGDVVECGVYKGGTAANLARSATHSRLARTVWLFDVFEGMSPATDLGGPGVSGWVGNLISSLQKVSCLLLRTGPDLSRVRIVPCLFQYTFPSVHIPQIALLNIDAYWYESFKPCLETFYNAVVPRGFISLDDSCAWPGCRLAVDQFFQSRQLSFPLIPADREAHWFQKL